MLINFKMENDKGIMEYSVFGKWKDGYLVFMDKHIPNTVYQIKISSERICIKRCGNISMNLEFVKHKKIKGDYQNKEGIMLDIASYTKLLSISDDGFFLEYDFFVSDEYQTTNKLSIKY